MIWNKIKAIQSSNENVKKYVYENDTTVAEF